MLYALIMLVYPIMYATVILTERAPTVYDRQCMMKHGSVSTSHACTAEHHLPSKYGIYYMSVLDRFVRKTHLA